MKEELTKRMQELSRRLKAAARAYYAEDRELMSDREYDALYDELQRLEEETGIVFADSPTVNVGYEAVEYLPKETHARPMLSLDKTKDIETLRSFVGDQKTLLSWKLDGLTIVLTYRDGALQKAVTRGNGQVGEVVTGNARVFKNLPLRIKYQGELILRGEAIITYPEFERINAEIEDADARYKNPRNLCSGSVRQLDNAVTAERAVRFYAFSLVQAPGVDFHNSHEAEFDWLLEQGFAVVEHRVVDAGSLDDAMAYFKEQVGKNEFPSDGLVALYDDIAYGDALGATAKFPRNAFAFKWADELAKTVLREVEWSPSRTGLLNPVAIFDPVDLEGTVVSRASVHNVSIVRELALGIGDEITVYKANMIIPQIAENLTKSNALTIPERCPACGGATKIAKREEVETLHCVNPDCPAKQMKSYTLFVSRDAMNIEGLSEATLEKFMAHGLIRRYADIYHLADHRETILSMDGFGERSFDKLRESIDRSRETTMTRLLYSLGIPGVGFATARAIALAFGESLDDLQQADAEKLLAVEGVGEVLAADIQKWFDDKKHKEQLDALLSELTLVREYDEETQQDLGGLTFVITGSLVHYENRSALKKQIETRGGKVAGSVSKKTDYLINNDPESGSSKNRTARELGIPIISEEEYISRFGKE